ncbi:phosphoethanolamine transferase [Porphyromonas pogonae]|uniref:phosphoethanolamine transferase n=1 Tax=Porphyromonas pogonae TaxID=867595 RepID=UPI002E7AAD0D|nr:sulfatase-like hydrolase/transferase [Porphyromonas pogonae]
MIKSELYTGIKKKRQKILYFVFCLILILPNILLTFTEPYTVVSKIANLLLPLFVYMFLLTLKRKPGAMMWWLFIFVFFGAFQLVLLNLFGNSIIAVDMFLNVLSTSVGEASELLDNMLLAISSVLLIYVPCMTFAVYSTKYKEDLDKAFRSKMKRIAVGGFALSLLLIPLCKYSNKRYKGRNEVFPVNVLYNLYLSVDRVNKTAHYYETSKGFTYHAKSTHSPELDETYVLVIGETSRACSWGLYGYKRETNPLLMQIAPELVVFRDNLSQSNTTHKSVPIILSPADADHTSELHKVKSVITAYKEAGFYTSFLSNQAYNRAYIDFFAKEADNCFFIREQGNLKGKRTMDADLLPLLQETLGKHKKNLIILHTYGSHFNYSDRYKREDAVFTPDKITSTSIRQLNQLRNGYDNSIRTTDKFLYSVINMLKTKNNVAGMLFIADHGEDIYDDERERFLHSSPTTSYYQIHVPYILWTSEGYRQAFPDKVNAARRNAARASSSNTVFHTLLDLGGIDTKYKMDSLSLTSDSFKDINRCYLNDHNESIPMGEIGLKKEDERMFKKFHLKMY